MRIVLVGSKWLAAAVLSDLAATRRHDLFALAPSADDRLASASRSLGIPVGCHSSAERVEMDEVPECDVVLAAHCHAYLPGRARSRARHGVVAYHPSLLPLHRGADAVRWTIRDRDRVAGGTVYQMDDGADTGPVIAQDWCFVRPDDDAAGLWRRELGPLGRRLLGDVVSALDRDGWVDLRPQPDLKWPGGTWEPRLAGRRLGG